MQTETYTWLDTLVMKARDAHIDLNMAKDEAEAELPALADWGPDAPWVALGKVLRRKLHLADYPPEPGLPVSGRSPVLVPHLGHEERQ